MCRDTLIFPWRKKKLWAPHGCMGKKKHACDRLRCIIWYIVHRQSSAGSSEWNSSERKRLLCDVELLHTIASYSSRGPSVSSSAIIGRPGTRAFSLGRGGALAPIQAPMSPPLVHWILLLSDLDRAGLPYWVSKPQWLPVSLFFHSNIEALPCYLHTYSKRKRDYVYSYTFLTQFEDVGGFFLSWTCLHI